MENKDYPLRGHQELQIEVIKTMIKENFSIGEIAETFSVSTPTIKWFLKKHNVKVSDIRSPLSSSRRIKITNLETKETFFFRKKLDAAEWLHDNVNNSATAQSHLSNLTYHLNNHKPYLNYLIEYDDVEKERAEV